MPPITDPATAPAGPPNKPSLAPATAPPKVPPIEPPKPNINFNAGKGLGNIDQIASVKGSIAGAKHVHELSKEYNATVLLHTDHAARKLLPWIDGLISESEKHYEKSGKPLFSSHMIDLSEEQNRSGLLRNRESYLGFFVIVCRKDFTQMHTIPRSADSLPLPARHEAYVRFQGTDGGQRCLADPRPDPKGLRDHLVPISL